MRLIRSCHIVATFAANIVSASAGITYQPPCSISARNCRGAQPDMPANARNATTFTSPLTMRFSSGASPLRKTSSSTCTLRSGRVVARNRYKI